MSDIPRIPSGGFNLPPGVTLNDIDPPVCPECEGQGEVEVADDDWMPCQRCGGLGIENTRTKGTQ